MIAAADHERRQHVGQPSALLQQIDLERERQPHAAAHQDAVAAERPRADGAEPALGQHEAPNEDPRDEKRAPQVAPPGVIEREEEAERAGHGVAVAPGVDETNVAPARDDAAEDVGLLEVVIVRVDDRDRQRHVRDRRQASLDRAPQLAPDAIQQERGQRHVDDGGQPEHPVREAEHLAQQRDVPEQRDGVVHVVGGTGRQVLEIADDRQHRLPAPHVVGRHPDGRDRREVSVGHRAGDSAQRDAQRQQDGGGRHRGPCERDGIGGGKSRPIAAQPIAEAMSLK